MCGSDPNLAPQTNSAKCWSIPIMIFAIISCIGFLGGAWVQGIGGVLGLVASSMLICCGPKAAGEGGGMTQGAMILYVLGAIAEILGAVLGLLAYFALVDTYTTTCGGSEQCLNLAVGITAIIIFPSVALGIVAGVLQLVGAFKAFKSKQAIDAGGITVQK